MWAEVMLAWAAVRPRVLQSCLLLMAAISVMCGWWVFLLLQAIVTGALAVHMWQTLVAVSARRAGAVLRLS
jgi:hypothetical protein